MDKVILITGTSSGIGKCTATYLSERGYRVYGTYRKSVETALPFETIKMDVNEEGSVKEGIHFVIEKEKKIDVLINNAGFGYSGSIEDTSMEEAKAQFETNFFASFRLCKYLLPFMRKQGEGQIINISSLAGVIAIPFQGMYCASKYAIEGMTESLRIETKRFNIKVSLVEPGDFKTRFAENRILTKSAQGHSVYEESMKRCLSIMKKNEQRGPHPILIAKLIHKVIKTRYPKIRYPIGMADQRLAVTAKRLFPARVLELLVKNNYNLC